LYLECPESLQQAEQGKELVLQDTEKASVLQESHQVMGPVLGYHHRSVKVAVDSQKSLLHQVGLQILGLQDRMVPRLVVGHQDSLLGLDNLQVLGSLQPQGSHHLELVGRHLLPLEESH
jgi:hypothetical protein